MNSTGPVSTLLVVDDTPSNIMMLNDLLGESYKIVFATTGVDALTLAGSGPDLILLDIVMPGMDGYEVCGRLKERDDTRDIPVIFLTSCTDTDDLVRAFSAGGVDYVTRPFKTSELRARVDTHLQLRKANRDLLVANSRLEAALEDNRMLVREVYHRVKNNLNVACSLLNLQGELVKDPRDAALFVEARDRIMVMSGIHELLYKSTSLKEVPAGEFITAIVHKLIRSYGRGDLHPAIVCNGYHLTLDTVIPCGLIINELVTNSLKYAFPEGKSGTIAVSLAREDGDLVLTVRDDGGGLPPGLDISRAESLGLTLVTSLTHQLGGSLNVERGKGTGFVVRFPAPSS